MATELVGIGHSGAYRSTGDGPIITKFCSFSRSQSLRSLCLWPLSKFPLSPPFTRPLTSHERLCYARQVFQVVHPVCT